ncbi:unnamed protein product [marine sediment metagenome]|uniref:Uncharacterized protein n=1 Tax=marine sediment metagenome TaxID=412755 RepID=X1KD29_9ZZZZ
MLIAIVNTAIVEPIPNFLPSSIVNAEAAGIEMAPARPPKMHSPSRNQKLWAKGIIARKVRLIRLPRITRDLLLNLSAILPE